MKNSSKKFLTIIAAAVLSLAQYGCLSDLLAPTADPTVFHVISPVQIEKKYDCKCDVNLQAAQLPQYMSRQQIVSLAESGILLVSEFDRWAELPSDGFERALAVDIESSGGRVGIYVSGRIAGCRKGLLIENIRLRMFGKN